MRSQQDKVANLQDTWQIQGVEADEGSAGAGDEDADLVDGIVGWIEGTILAERRVVEWEEECRSDALIDRVFGNVHEK